MFFCSDSPSTILSLMVRASCENFNAKIARVRTLSFELVLRANGGLVKSNLHGLMKECTKKTPQVIPFKIKESMLLTVRKMST